MEFQFGTNWAASRAYAGSVVGQTLAMEGVFAFFLESSFLGALRLRRAAAVARGALRSPPSRCSSAPGSRATSSSPPTPSCSTRSATRWAPTACSTWPTSGRSSSTRGRSPSTRTTWWPRVVTASFVVAAVGAYYTLHGRARRRGADLPPRGRDRAGSIASVLVAFPTGDRQAKLVARAPAGGARRDGGPFESGPRAGLAIIGQPNVASGGSTTRSSSPGALSFLAFGTFHADVPGLDDFPERRLARQHRAALLRVPRHGRARDPLHRAHGRRGLPAPGADGSRAARPVLWAARCSPSPSPTSRTPPAG